MEKELIKKLKSLIEASSEFMQFGDLETRSRLTNEIEDANNTIESFNLSKQK